MNHPTRFPLSRDTRVPLTNYGWPVWGMMRYDYFLYTDHILWASDFQQPRGNNDTLSILIHFLFRVLVPSQYPELDYEHVHGPNLLLRSSGDFKENCISLQEVDAFARKVPHGNDNDEPCVGLEHRPLSSIAEGRHVEFVEHSLPRQSSLLGFLIPNYPSQSYMRTAL